MPQLILIILGFVLFTIFISHFKSKNSKAKYHYRRKQFFMTRAEHQCYKALLEAVGQEYFVFAQVHLPTILDHTIRGQNWRAARASIDRRSVDFVLCDKDYISPKLAIELDDKTHERPDRQKRDKFVEGILEYAGMPLLRLENHGRFEPEELKKHIQKFL